MTGRRTRPLSRGQYLLGTAALVVLGVVLVSVLAVLFGREGPTSDPGRTTVVAFAGPELGLEVVSGAVEARDGRAVATAADTATTAVALLDLAADEGRLVVTASEPARGWGVVFRWASPRDHWYLAQRDGGRLELGRVRDGRGEVLASAPARLSPGAAVDVRFDDRRADVRVDGALVLSARGHDRAGARVGLRADAPGAAWDDLRLGPRPTPVVRDDG